MQMGDTVFMFFCALLVWLMTPGLALFYGGMVKAKTCSARRCTVFLPRHRIRRLGFVRIFTCFCPREYMAWRD